MTPDETRNLAIECGMEIDLSYPTVYLFFPDELAAYTAAVEAPLQARCAHWESEARKISIAYDMAEHSANKLQSKLDKANTRIAQLEEALKAECGDRCNSEYNPCAARQVLNESPDTWLSEHDKEVRRDQIKIDAGICEIQDGMHDALYAEAIIYQHK